MEKAGYAFLNIVPLSQSDYKTMRLDTSQSSYTVITDAELWTTARSAASSSTGIIYCDENKPCFFSNRLFLFSISLIGSWPSAKLQKNTCGLSTLYIYYIILYVSSSLLHLVSFDNCRFSINLFASAVDPCSASTPARCHTHKNLHIYIWYFNICAIICILLY